MPIPEVPAAEISGGEPAIIEHPAAERRDDDAPEAVTASFLWDRREHVRLIRQITRHMTGGALWKVIAGLAALVWLASIVPLLMLGEWGAVLSSSWYMLAFAAFIVILRVARPRLGARAYAQQHTITSHPLHVTLSPHGVRLTTAAMDSGVTWAGVRRAVETREFFLFYVTDRTAQYLPKRALNGPAGVAAARAVILRHIPLKDATDR